MENKTSGFTAWLRLPLLLAIGSGLVTACMAVKADRRHHRGGEIGGMDSAPSILSADQQIIEDKLFPATPGVLGSKRLWRLTVPQFANKVRVLLGSTEAVEAKFDAETRPTTGFGVESDILAINPDYASKLEGVVGSLLQASPAALTKYLPCGAAANMTPQCLDSFIKAFGAAAFTRPVSPIELQRYRTVFQQIEPATGNEDALAAVADVILRSPYAQFRTELGSGGDADASRLTPTELATALAYSITNAPPTSELLTAAQNGALATPEGIRASAQGLMQGPGFVAGFSEFFLRYTGVAWIRSMPKDQMLYPEYTPAMMQAMVAETKAFVSNVMLNQKGDFRALMAGTATTILPDMASVYQVQPFSGSQHLTLDPTQRSGLFTLPGVIAANTKATDTSPVKRGVFLLNNLLCVSPPPPPPNVPSLDPGAAASLPLRQRFAMHVANPTCAACHAVIDPPGFALEHYDALGRYRTMDGQTPVDASGTVTGTQYSNVTFTSAVDLLQKVGNSPDVNACLVRNAFRYVFGRPETTGDAPVLRSAYEHFVASNLDINQIFLSFYTSTAFQARKGN